MLTIILESKWQSNSVIQTYNINYNSWSRLEIDSELDFSAEVEY